MQEYLRKEVARILRETADKFDNNTSEANDEQAFEIIKLIAHEPISKERAAIMLKIHPSRFDTLIREGKIPKGRKRIGWKELCWYKDEIENSEYVKSLTK